MKFCQDRTPGKEGHYFLAVIGDPPGKRMKITTLRDNLVYIAGKLSVIKDGSGLMTRFERYPHVKDFIEYYAKDLNKQNIIELLNTGIKNRDDAEEFCYFIWDMADKMASDSDAGKEVLGQIDNSDVLPDIHYEITLYLHNLGFMDVWNTVRDQVNS